MFTLKGGSVCWKSSKQHIIADSIYEAEYVAASDAAKVAVWIKKFFNDLGVVPSINGLVVLYSDNTGAIAQAKEPRSHHKTKHVLRHNLLVREIIE